METGDLLVTLFGDGVALDGAGPDGVKGFQFIASFEQCLAFLNRFFPFDDVVELVEFMLVQRERNAKLTNATVLTMDRTATRLDTSNNTLFRDHKSHSGNIDMGQF